ncbi:MAG: electron transporter RnfG [Candidatus Margulisiibacteriota bacterium]|nr:MAG: electron transporter RnfG [Candidatus Margulisiibacteriota bacterium]HCY36304.1 electron transporter RnfG [Candidatus Margulisiibacteriota bacterium]
MRDMLKPTLSLLFICVFFGFCLAVVNSLTADVIKQRVIESAQQQRKEVLPAAERFESLPVSTSSEIKAAYRGVASDKTIGYVFSSTPKGYGGAINVTVGIKMDGSLSGVKIGENKETPGLGTKAAEPGFINQYIKKSIKKVLTVVKIKPSADNEIQAISGATITSKAVTLAVNNSAAFAKSLIAQEVRAE